MIAVLTLFMSVLINPSTIESDQAASRYFLPYQLAWIQDDSRLKIWEKSFRIGATYADAFTNVRKRLVTPKRDYLFATRDQPSALEYMEICRQFCEVFNLTKNIVSHGVEIEAIPVHDKDGKPTGFTEDVKIGKIVFDNGSRIIAFSSNPNAMLVYGGDVGLDEFPRHGRAEELYQVAQARVTWGYDLSMWGSHFGNDTLFYRIALDARAGKGGWAHHFTTIEDACAQGLVKKINQTRGTTFTSEGFLADCKNRSRDEATYQEAYMCNPKGGTAAIVAWSQIELCTADYEAERCHLEGKQIEELFGKFDPATQTRRAERINDYLAKAFPRLTGTPGRHALGYDVAASGQGDLACIYLDRITGTEARAAGLLTFRTEDWDFHKVATRFFMRRVAGLSAAGDETGLGRQVCWELAQDFPAQFTPVNFSSEKHDMFFSLMGQLATAEKRWPKSWQDVSTDYFSFRKIHDGGKWRFVAGDNPLNADSHGDMATGGALASRAAALGAGAGFFMPSAPAAHTGSRQQARRERNFA